MDVQDWESAVKKWFLLKMFLNPYMRQIKCELNDFSDFFDTQTVFELLIDYMSELLNVKSVCVSIFYFAWSWQQIWNVYFKKCYSG